MTPELARTLIRRALETDMTFAVEAVLDSVKQGFATPFAGEKSFVLVRLWDEDDGRIAYTMAGGGDLKELRDELRPRVETFARNNECTWLEIRSRPGVERVLNRFGYHAHKREPGTVSMRKKL